jgi:hypothetical protein
MDFNTFSQRMQKHYSFNIKYKNDSFFMKCLSFPIYLFNQSFMKNYITTIGNTIYFPNKEFVNNRSAIEVLAHEIKHIEQANHYGFVLFSIMYLFPQIVAILFPLGFFGFLGGAFGIFFLFFIALGSLIPFGAYYRMLFEVEAYTVSLYCANKQIVTEDVDFRREVLKKYSLFMNEQFTGSGYYFMWRSGVLNTLHQNIEKILDGSIEADPFIAKIKEAMAD